MVYFPQQWVDLAVVESLRRFVLTFHIYVWKWPIYVCPTASLNEPSRPSQNPVLKFMDHCILYGENYTASTFALFGASVFFKCVKCE